MLFDLSISDNEIFITDAKDVRHIVRVLRLKQGAKAATLSVYGQKVG